MMICTCGHGADEHTRPNGDEEVNDCTVTGCDCMGWEPVEEVDPWDESAEEA